MIAAALLMLLWLAGGEMLHDPSSADTLVSGRATGTFDVTVTPEWTDDAADGTRLGRSSLEKRFHGGLQGTSRGEMLTVISAMQGSAGYVAVERVTGTLDGRTGTFVLQHDGLMDRGAQQLTIIVVPDTGTGQLEGLAGTMAIEIADGEHRYIFEYTLPASS